MTNDTKILYISTAIFILWIVWATIGYYNGQCNIESVAINDNDTTIPTSAAVKAYADTKLASDTSSVANSVAVNNVVLISQSNYDALGSYDANTLYFIT